MFKEGNQMVPAGLFGMNLVAELFLTVILGGLCGWAACQLLRMPWHKGDFFLDAFIAGAAWTTTAAACLGRVLVYAERLTPEERWDLRLNPWLLVAVGIASPIILRAILRAQGKRPRPD
jgi:hypothetical protein